MSLEQIAMEPPLQRPAGDKAIGLLLATGSFRVKWCWCHPCLLLYCVN